MVKNHLKSIASPKTWDIYRKSRVFTAKANPGAHNQLLSVPFIVFIRDMVKLVDNQREAKYILNNKEVLVNGKKIKDINIPVGRFDIIYFKDINTTFQILLNSKGKLVAKINNESKKLYRIAKKTLIKGGKIQLNFMDGSNILVEKDSYLVGDTVLLENKKVSEHLPLKKGMIIFLVGGKHIGQIGNVDDILGDKIIFINDKKEKIETLKKYAVVIGKDKPLVPIVN
jgi:small subunit ribosomal protein S4e